MKLYLLSGFLGSGKTTAIQNAAGYLLQKGVKVGVITNDQGSRLVDGNFFKSLKLPGEQVVDGCFCCNYNALDQKIESLIRTHNVDTIFAESVGSCTDVVATTFNPLLQFRPQLQVTVSTFADVRLLYDLLKNNRCLFDDDVKYIYYKQLEEAGIIVVSKVDLVSEKQLEELKKIMQVNYKNKIIHYQNSFDSNSIEEWLKFSDYQLGTALQSLKIDYDKYGSGEAKLAWLDQEIEVESADDNAIQNTVCLINSIFKRIKQKKCNIGHLKFLINENIKVSFTTATPASYTYKLDSPKAATATLLINARVQTTPEALSAIVTDAINEEERKTSCTISIRSLSSFQPGYPRPTYRIPNDINKNDFLITQKCILSLTKAGAEVFRVSGIEELVNLYHKTAPGIENILNTIPELGLVNAKDIEDRDPIERQTVYQIWVLGALAVAENGAIWLEGSSVINRLIPLNCEYLIVILEVSRIVEDMKQAYEKIKISKKDYGMRLEGSGKIADTGQSFANSLIIYLIDPGFSEKEKLATCGPDCYCYKYEFKINN